MKKSIFSNLAFLLLLTLIVISCRKGDNRAIQKASVSKKITDYFPHFVPLRTQTYADVFLLDDATLAKYCHLD